MKTLAPHVLFIVILLGCARRGPVPKRVVPHTPAEVSTAASVEVAASPDKTVDGHRQGVWEGPKLSTKPRVQWERKFRGPVVHPLTLCSEHIYAVSDSTLYKLTPDGTTLWESNVGADGKAACTKKGILVAASSGTMILIDDETGMVLSSFGGFESIRTPALPLWGGWGWVERDGVLLTKDTQNGPLIQGPVTDGASNGEVIIVGNVHGIVGALSPGGSRWQAKVPGPVSGQPIILDERVFVPFGAHRGKGGGMAAIDTKSGEILWVSKFGPGVSAPPAVGGFLVVPSKDGDLVALDPKHGGTRWRTPREVKISTKPAIVKDAVYVGDGLGRITAYDMADGGSVWMIEAGAPVTGDPIVLDGLLVFGTADGRIIGLSK